MEKKYLFFHLFSLLLFGSNGVVASKIALESEEIVLFRTLIGGTLLCAFFLLGGGKFSFYRYKKDFFFLCLSGVSMGASWMFLYEAFARVGVSVASLLYACGPVIVMMFSPLVFREKLTPRVLLGFFAVFVGVVFVNGGIPKGEEDLFGFISGLLSAVCYSFMVIFNKKAYKIKGLENSALQLLVAFITVASFVGAKSGFAFHVEKESILPILILGAINTGFGCYLYFSSIGRLKAQTVAVCEYLELVSSVVFSAIFLGETLLPLQILGALLIVGGAVFGKIKVKKRKR